MAWSAAATRAIDGVLRSGVDQGDVPGVEAVVATTGGTVYQSAFGLADTGSGEPLSVGRIWRIASMTKLATSLVALHMIETGQLDLDTLVADVVPAFAGLPVLDGFDVDGTPRLRPASRPARIRHLLTHTSGLAYDTWNHELRKYHEVTGLPGLGSGLLRCFDAPLVADPGTAFHYGTSMDWLGRVLAEVSGTGLEQLFGETLFDPLGMGDSWLWVNTRPEVVARIVPVHVRQPDGSWIPTAADYWDPAVTAPEYLPAGHGMYCTAADYLCLQRLVLAGSVNGFRLVRPETLDLLFEDQLSGRDCGVIPSAIPAASEPIDLTGWGWSMGLLLARGGRSADLRSPGSAGWEGGFNTFFWIDRERQVTAAMHCASLPFYDAGTIRLYRRFEAAVGRVAETLIND